MKARLPWAFVLMIFLAGVAYALLIHRDAVRDARWHLLQQQQLTHAAQQAEHDAHGGPLPSVPALTGDETTELAGLNRWAEARGENVKP